MTDRQKNLIALLLAVAGVVVLGSTWLRTRAPEDQPALDRAVQSQLETESLFSSRDVTFESGSPRLPSQGLLALFVLHGKVCPPSLNEVAEYTRLLDEIRRQGVEVRPVALLFEEDAARAVRFIKISGLPMPVGHGRPAVFARSFGQYGQTDDGMTFQQLLFIQLPEEIVFYRVLLPNTITDVETKREVLRRMLEARDRARSSTSS